MANAYNVGFFIRRKKEILEKNAANKIFKDKPLRMQQTVRECVCYAHIVIFHFIGKKITLLC